jgi:CheY-like chemotaxis protein
MSVKILLVEDDIWLAELYRDVLQIEKNCTILTAGSAAQALERLDDNPEINLIVLDMFLPEHNGIEFLHEVASYNDINQVPVIVLSSVYKHDFGMSEERWRHYGVVQHLYKPQTKPQDLVIEIKKHLAGAL